MNEKNKEQQHDRLEEQGAPLKNTDQAFVQVGRDGGPVVPQKADLEGEKEKDDLHDPNSYTTIRHR